MVIEQNVVFVLLGILASGQIVQNEKMSWGRKKSPGSSDGFRGGADFGPLLGPLADRVNDAALSAQIVNTSSRYKKNQAFYMLE